MQLRYRGHQSRGDSLIEVLLALAVMSTVITLSVRTMNLGFASVFNATERTEVQSLLNGQVAMLRAAHDEHVLGATGDDWTSIINKTSSVAGDLKLDGCTYSTGAMKQFFFDNTQGGAGKKWTTPQNVPAGNPPLSSLAIPVAGNGIWVEGLKTSPNAGGVDYYDFYIKACWQATGEGPNSQLKTVLRLYAS